MKLVICGDCYANHLLKCASARDKISKHLELMDCNIGNGNTESQEFMIDFINFQDGDVFLLGGLVQETYRSRDTLETHLKDLIDKIFTKYPNSKIIFWNMLARSDQAYRKHHEMVCEVRKSFVNYRNILCFEFFQDDTAYVDASHLTNSKKVDMFESLANYIEENKDKLFEKRIVSKTVERYMEFESNKKVEFILRYPLAKNTVHIKCINEDGLESNFNIVVGVNAQGDGRLQLFKHPRLKSVQFSDNIEVIKCVVKYY